jgi:aldose 1-epimerase
MSSPILTITNGDAVAVINLLGSALVGLRFGEHAVIPETDLGPKVFAGTLLTPWPNRVAKGKYEFEGRKYELPIREVLGNALHGMVDENFAEIVQESHGFAKLLTYVSATDGYPANLKVESSFTLTTTELKVSYSVTNQGPGNAPVGIGTHPYFPFTSETKIEINAKVAAVHGSDMIPIGEISAAELGLGAGVLAEVSKLALDTQFTDLGNPVARVFEPGFGYEIWQENANWLMVYTSHVFPWAAGAGNAIAIEPQTVPADSFNTGQDLRVLASGESTLMHWGIRLQG